MAVEEEEEVVAFRAVCSGCCFCSEVEGEEEEGSIFVDCWSSWDRPRTAEIVLVDLFFDVILTAEKER